MRDDSFRPAFIDRDKLPRQFPTQAHPAVFWEHLGRAVATFGTLEGVLGRAIFALTGTAPVLSDDAAAEVTAWSRKLERSLFESLGPLIDLYCSAARAHPNAATGQLGELEARLREAKRLRDVLCHGEWDSPTASGHTTPRFVDRKLQEFTTSVDVAFLDQTQRAVAELICDVMDSVTTIGIRFPGTQGPGQPVW